MENKINDNDIKEYFFTKLNKLYTKKFLDFEKTHFPKEIYEYLINRYNDSQSLKETVYRINFGYDVRPVCENCGKPIKFLGKPSRMWKTYCSNQCRYSLNRLNKYKQTCLEKYGVEYAQQSNKVKDKAKQTCLEKYGVEHYTNREKSKQTCLEKYGVESNLNIPEVKEKIKKTCLEKYGVEFFTKADIVKEKIKQTCLEKYGVEYILQSKEFREKSKQTCLEKYGVEFSSQADVVKEKIKQTCLEKYGVTNGGGSEQALEKIKQTCLKRYGLTNGGGSKESLEKIKQTCLERYGVDCSFKIDSVQEKIKQTCLKKYGVYSYSKTEEYSDYMSKLMSSKEMQDKINETKRKNHTFNTSKIENKLYKEIKLIFPSVIAQYNKDDRYLWNCDFYIPELDMFIEFQGSWTHGKHPFDYNSKEDQEILKKWKIKNTKYYNNAIQTWIDRDPKKRETAKKNNLNYVELFNKEDINLFLINLQNIKDEKFK